MLVSIHGNKSCIKAFENLGIPSPKEWQKIATIMTNPSLWEEPGSEKATRLAKALAIAKRYSKNGENDGYYASILFEAMNEINSEDEGMMLTDLVDHYEEEEVRTINICNTIRGNARAKRKNLDIGYVSMTELDFFIDYDEIIRQGLEKFPNLFYIEHINGERKRFSFYSHTINVGKVCEKINLAKLHKSEKNIIGMMMEAMIAQRKT